MSVEVGFIENLWKVTKEAQARLAAEKQAKLIFAIDSFVKELKNQALEYANGTGAYFFERQIFPAVKIYDYEIDATLLKEVGNRLGEDGLGFTYRLGGPEKKWIIRVSWYEKQNGFIPQDSN